MSGSRLKRGDTNRESRYEVSGTFPYTHAVTPSKHHHTTSHCIYFIVVFVYSFAPTLDHDQLGDKGLVPVGIPSVQINVCRIP